MQGIWQTADKGLATQYGFQPGDVRLVDGNGDGKYTIADKKFMGDLAPKYSWNMRNEFKIYKNFDFSFTLYARTGQFIAMCCPVRIPAGCSATSACVPQ